MAQVYPEHTLDKIRENFKIPAADSHKGQNGKLLIIGGSSLFHSAVLWSAEIASHFVDMVHFCSTEENNKIFLQLKSLFHNGIIIRQKDVLDYAAEDDCILLGPGMVREGDEADYARNLTHDLLNKFSSKKFVIDAGAMQIMKPELLTKLTQKAVITPHQKEFEMLFGENIENLTVDEKKSKAKAAAKKYSCIILLKAIVDIVTDGERIVTIEGGNAGLTKGGTGDTLAGLTAALATTNDSFDSAVLASFLVKTAAEKLEKTSAYWYNTTELIEAIPKTARELLA